MALRLLLVVGLGVSFGCQSAPASTPDESGLGGGKFDSAQCADARMDEAGRCRNANGTFAASVCCEMPSGNGVEYLLELHVAVRDESVYDGDFASEGFVWDGAESQWMWDGVLELGELPFRGPFSLTGLDVRISADGFMSLGYSYGDYDQTAHARTKLAIEQTASGPMIASEGYLSGSGGDNASGVWSFDAEATVRSR